MLPADIKRLIEIHAEASGLAPASVARYAYGSGDFWRRLEAGTDITSRRAAKVAQWLSDHWPEEEFVFWPADIPRPEPAAGSPAARALAPDPALTALDRHGRIADPEAFLKALTPFEISRATLDQVVSQYRDGRNDTGAPKRGSRAYKVLLGLMAAGDARFIERRRRVGQLLGLPPLPADREAS